MTAATDREIEEDTARWEQAGSLFCPLGEDDADQDAGALPLPGMLIGDLCQVPPPGVSS